MFKRKRKHDPPKWNDAPHETECIFCGAPYMAVYLSDAHENCPRRRDSMTWAQFLQVLENLKNAIETTDLSYWNSDAIGDKGNACSWGLCTENPAVYPDPDMHTFPWLNETQGRHAPNHSHPGMNCPMRYDLERVASGKPMWEAPTYGCFYDCRFFNPPKGQARPTRQEAANIVQSRINLVQEWLNKGTVVDA